MSVDKPNVIFILSDDQGPWAVGCYGNKEIKTENIDRLAQTGVVFTNFFVSSPVCSPSRATFLTGKIPSQHGIHDWIREGNVGKDACSYLENQLCYTDILAENGWRCGISGKWHLGNSQIPQHGFSYWFVHQRGGGPYNNAPMVRDGKLVDEPGYITDVITEEAIKFIEESVKNGDQPFYLSIHYTAPHSPWTGHPQHIVDSYDDCPFESCPQEPRHPWATELTDQCLGNREMLKGYFAAVTAMDINIGKVLDKIEELDILQNTLIFFFSDNGFNCGHHGFWGKGNGTYPLNMYENSIKVPAIASHPGKIPQGLIQEAMISNYDFMPTLLDYLGLQIPNDIELPGKSFLPELLGKDASGDESVVIFDEYGKTRMVRTKEWKYVFRPDGPCELYNLINDPLERENLVQDPSRRRLISDLKGIMFDWFDRYVVPERDGMNYEVTGLGQMRPIGMKSVDDRELFYSR